MTESGDRLIIDAVATAKAMEIWRGCLAPVKPYFVYVGAPIKVLVERERVRGDRTSGLAAEQLFPTRIAANYDHYIDTSALSCEEAAKEILAGLSSHCYESLCLDDPPKIDR